jgi:hypothetical protein
MERITQCKSTRAILLAAVAVCQSADAEETVATLGPDWTYPLVYSTALMAGYLPLLIATGTFDAGPSINNFERAFTAAPRWDNDSAGFNYVLHPLWGSETYLRAREARFGIPGSIAFSMGMSVAWEYLIESWVEQPSTTDLIFTTGIGWTLGELRYRLKQHAGERMEWFLDPIEKTLEHFQVVVARDRNGNTAAGLTFAIRF